MLGSAENEHPRLTNREIIFEEFQPMWSQSTNVTDRQTDGQTDDMRLQDHAICTVVTCVHRTVKTTRPEGHDFKLFKKGLYCISLLIEWLILDTVYLHLVLILAVWH